MRQAALHLFFCFYLFIILSHWTASRMMQRCQQNIPQWCGWHVARITWCPCSLKYHVISSNDRVQRIPDFYNLLQSTVVSWKYFRNGTVLWNYNTNDSGATFMGSSVRLISVTSQDWDLRGSSEKRNRSVSHEYMHADAYQWGAVMQ